MSRSFDDQWDRDNEREPTRLRTPTKRIPINPAGTVRTQFVQHGAECTCAWCVEQPETAAALAVLRRGGLL